MESILTSIKKLLGIHEEDTHFDEDIIMHINSVFMVLNQIGVGPSEGFFIEDESTTWDEYIPNPAQLQAVKSYMHMKVKLIFDPPSSSVIKACIDENIKELESRLNYEVDYY